MPHRALARLLLLLLPGCALFSLSGAEERALALHRDNAKYWYDREDMNRARQQALLGLRIEPEDLELNLLLGWLHLRRDTRDDAYEAEAYFRKIEGGGLFHRRVDKASRGLAIALRRQADHLVVAAARLERGEIRPDPGKEAADEVVRLRRRAGEKYDEAVDLLEELVRDAEPDPDPLALDTLQQILALQGETDRSLAYGKRFVAQAELSRRFWRRVLEEPDLPAHKEKDARAKLADNLRREVESRGLAANLLFEKRRFSEAEAELTALLALDPERPEEYFNRARCRIELKRSPDAIADLQEFLRRTTLPFRAPQVLLAYDLLREWAGEEGLDALRGAAPASRATP